MTVRLAIMLAAALVACTPSTSAPGSAAATVTTVRAWREVDVTLHADVETPDELRRVIDGAAATWWAASGGRIRIRVVYDVDFDSPLNLLSHRLRRHSMLLMPPLDSDEVARIDATHGGPGRRPLAETRHMLDGRVVVTLILDRIDHAQLRELVLHELGHVAGLPDLPTRDAVMSLARWRGAPPVNDLTPEDFAVCRAAMLCP